MVGTSPSTPPSLYSNDDPNFNNVYLMSNYSSSYINSTKCLSDPYLSTSKQAILRPFFQKTIHIFPLLNSLWSHLKFKVGQFFPKFMYTITYTQISAPSWLFFGRTYTPKSEMGQILHKINNYQVFPHFCMDPLKACLQCNIKRQPGQLLRILVSILSADICQSLTSISRSQSWVKVGHFNLQEV